MRITSALPATTALALAAIFQATPALAMDDQATFWRFDGRVEKRLTSVAPATDWATSAWIGDDSTKLRLQNSGVIDDSGRIDNEGGSRGIDTRFFYSRRISDFWDAKAGVQFTVFDQGVTRSGFAAGVEGLAPYGIHLDAVLGVSQTGVVSGRLEATYDVLLSQKLIAQPFVEAMLASQDDPAIQLGSGLARYEVGLRLRYEIAKEFAPYLGVSFEQFTGTTASLVAAEGGPTANLRALVGLKVWF
jgi:copper resistance protein B